MRLLLSSDALISSGAEACRAEMNSHAPQAKGCFGKRSIRRRGRACTHEPGFFLFVGVVDAEAGQELAIAYLVTCCAVALV